MVRIEHWNNRILCRYTPYVMKDILKALPDARWERKEKAWSFAAVPEAALALVSLFPEHNTDDEIIILIDKKKEQDAAQELKTVPVSNLQDFETDTEPWEHQKRAFWFARSVLEATGGCMLGMEMGCGKTKVAIDLTVNMPDVSTVLVTSPLSVVPVWPEQYALHAHKHYDISVLPLGYGVKSVRHKQRAAERFLSKADSRDLSVVVVNHESLWREPFGMFAKDFPWDMIIVDEIHRAKSAGGKFSQYLSSLRDRIRHRLGLTGTIMPHSPIDPYAQYRFLDIGLFGSSFIRYKNKFTITEPIVVNGQKISKIIGFKNLDVLEKKMASCTYVVKSDDVLDLPEINDIYLKCDLSDSERRVYERMEKDLIAAISEGAVVTAANQLVRLLRLQQIVQGTVKDEDGNKHEIGTTKEDVLRDLLLDLPSDEPVVVFCLFHSDLDRVHCVCKAVGRNSFEISGRREKQNKEWQRAEGGEVLAAQFKAGSEGVDYTRSRYMAFMCGTFNMGQYWQARKREHRPGQRRTCFYYHLFARNTIDAKVYQSLRDKEKVVESVIRGIQKGEM